MNVDPKELAKQFTPTKPKNSKPFESDRKQHNGARYSPCGKFLVAGGYQGNVLRWDVTGEAPKSLEPLTGHNGWVQAYAFAPSGKWLFTGDSWGRLQAWDYTAEKPKAAWNIAEAHAGWLRSIAVSGDGKVLATCGRDQVVRLWDAATGKKLHELTGHNEDVFVVRFHPDGKSLVSGDLKGVIKQWDLATKKHARDFDAKVLFTLNRLQDVGSVRAIAFDKDGKHMLASGTKPKNGGNVQGVPTILVFDWAGGKQTKEFNLGVDGDVYVCDLQFDSRGFFMAAVSGNPGTGKFAFLRIEDKEPFVMQTFGNCHALSMHPDQKHLAATGVNGNSSGNGRVKGMGPMDYPGNYSPITFFDIPG